MPVNSVHKEYAAKAKQWKVMRDTVAGQDAVHAAGKEYLPKLDTQTPDEFNAYVARANFYNATGRTVDAMRGMVFRKDPTLKGSTALTALLDDVNLNGTSLVALAEQLVEELLTTTRVGVLVDFPQQPTQAISVAQAEQLGQRPMMVLYTAESIINWRFTKLGNRQVLSMVVLEEQREQPTTDDGYEVKTDTQYRVLRLLDGVYVQEVWEAGDNGSYVLTQRITPLMGGAALKAIPFYIFGGKGLNMTAKLDVPVLKDLADVNLAHYRNSADYEHGLHRAGLPTPYVTGWRADPSGNNQVTIGPNSMLLLPDPQSTAGYMEFKGDGLKYITTEMQAKEQRMAALGATMLTPEKKAAAAAAALDIKRTGETSVLGGMVEGASNGLTAALKLFAEWAGEASTAVPVELNLDFTTTVLSAQDIEALVKAWQASAISFDVLIYNLKGGDVVPESMTADDIRDQLAADGPALANLTGNNGDGGNPPGDTPPADNTPPAN